MRNDTIRHAALPMSRIFVLLLCVFSLVIPAAAANLTNTLTVENAGNLVLSYSNTSSSGSAAIEADGKTITLKANKFLGFISTTTTLTIQNSGNIKLTVYYTEDGSSGEKTLEPNGSFPISVSSSAGTKQIVINEIKLDDTKFTTTFLPGKGGSYTVDNQKVTAETQLKKSAAESYTIKVTPDSGMELDFFKITTADGKVTLMNPNADGTLTLQIGSDTTVQPAFKKSGAATYYILGAEGTYYNYLDDALEAAGTSAEKTIVLYKSGTVFHSDGSTKVFDIPANVTLLLPRVKDATDVTGTEDKLHYANYNTWSSDSRWQVNPATNRNLLLTIPGDTTVNNNGKIVLGGTIAAQIAYFNGATLSSNYYKNGVKQDLSGYAHSDLQLDGTLNMVGDKSVLSSIGFIQGSGSINALGSGAKIYQPFVVNDFKGGTYTTAAAGQSGNLDVRVGTINDEESIAPFMRYTMMNIRTTLNLEAGNYLYGYCDLYAGDKHNLTTTLIIGYEDGEIGLLNLKSGASVTAKYTGQNAVQHLDTFEGTSDKPNKDTYNSDGWGYNQVGRTNMTITGGASMASLSLNVYLSETQFVPVSMGNTTFPIPYNFNITLLDGEYCIPTSMVLLPGAELTVGQEANLIVGDGSKATRFMVMDGFFDHTMRSVDGSSVTTYYGYYPDTTYPKTGELQTASLPGTACLTLDGGTLTVNSGVNFGGLVQTTGTEGSQVTFNGTSGCNVQMGLTGMRSGSGWLSKDSHIAGATIRDLPARLMDQSGTYFTMEAGKVYQGIEDDDNTITLYSFDLYTTSSDTSKHTTHEEKANIVCSCGKNMGGTNDCVCNIFAPIPVQGAWAEGVEVTVWYIVDGELVDSVTKSLANTNAALGAYFIDQACTTQATTENIPEDKILYFKTAAKVDWTAESRPDTYYADLQSAIDSAVNAGDTVVVLSDLILDAIVTAAADQDITLDLNGHSVTAPQFIEIPAGATVNITSSADTKGTIRGILESAAGTDDGSKAITDAPGVISNSGSLSVSNVNINQNTATPRAGIFNAASGTISSIDNVTIDLINDTSVACSYGIANLGAITTIGPTVGKPVVIRGANYGIRSDGGSSTIHTVGEVDIDAAAGAIWMIVGSGSNNGGITQIGIDGGTTKLTGDRGIYAGRKPIETIGVSGSKVYITAPSYGIYSYGAGGKVGTIGASGSYVEINSEGTGIYVYYSSSVKTIGEKPGDGIDSTVVINANKGIHLNSGNGTATIDTIGSVNIVCSGSFGIHLQGGVATNPGRTTTIDSIGMKDCVTRINGSNGINVTYNSTINHIGSAGDVRIAGGADSNNYGIYFNNGGNKSIGDIGNGGRVEIFGGNGISSSESGSGVISGIYKDATIVSLYSGKYAVNTTYLTVETFHGGNFYNASGKRANTIMDPDNASGKTVYAEGYELSTEVKYVTLREPYNDNVGYDCYYIKPINVIAGTVTGGGTTDVEREYASLMDAIAAYQSMSAADKKNSYVVLYEDTTEAEDITLNEDLYLDLNGYTVNLGENALTLDGCILYGMDSRTNAYSDEDAGAIIGTINGKVAPVTEHTGRGANGSKSYVKVSNGENEISFHRVGVSLTGVQIALASSGDNAWLAFEGTFRATQNGVDLLRDMGFRIDGTDTWYTTGDNTNAQGGKLDKTSLEPGASASFYYTKEIKTVNDVSEAAALLKFADNSILPSTSRDVFAGLELAVKENSSLTAEEIVAFNKFLGLIE